MTPTKWGTKVPTLDHLKVSGLKKHFTWSHPTWLEEGLGEVGGINMQHTSHNLCFALTLESPLEDPTSFL